LERNIYLNTNLQYYLACNNKKPGLYLINMQLTALPSSISALTNLKTLCLNENQLTTFPSSMSYLTNLTSLNLSYNQLSTIPEVLSSLISLEWLYFNNNQLTTLPSSISALKNLKRLDLANNRLTELPEVLTTLGKLNDLNLGDNRIPILLESFPILTSLEKLNVKGNQLVDYNVHWIVTSLHTKNEILARVLILNAVENKEINIFKTIVSNDYNFLTKMAAILSRAQEKDEECKKLFEEVLIWLVLILMLRTIVLVLKRESYNSAEIKDKMEKMLEETGEDLYLFKQVQSDAEIPDLDRVIRESILSTAASSQKNIELTNQDEEPNQNINQVLEDKETNLDQMKGTSSSYPVKKCEDVSQKVPTNAPECVEAISKLNSMKTQLVFQLIPR
jgi:hypothetical protein